MLALTEFVVAQMPAEAALGEQLDDLIGRVYKPSEEFDHER